MASPNIQMHIPKIGMIQAIEVRHFREEWPRILRVRMKLEAIDTEASDIEEQQKRQDDMEFAEKTNKDISEHCEDRMDREAALLIELHT